MISFRFPNRRFPTFHLPFILLLILIPGTTAFAQVDDVIRTDTSLIQLNVGVVDRQGRPITSLSRSDFVVYEDGVRQSILHFEPTTAPFSLVLMLDVSGSTVNFRQQLKQAAFRFLDALAPEDRVEVIQFNAKVKTLAPFSTDRKKTVYAIEQAEGAGETYFYDALRYALKSLEGEDKRRKAIIVLTDGLDTKVRKADSSAAASAETNEAAVAAIKPIDAPQLNAVLAQAERQNVTIYPLALPSGDPKRLSLPSPVTVGAYAAARMRLQAIANRTGGRLNEIHQLHELARVYAEVAADLRSLYTVAYQAPGDRRDGKWHEVRVEVAHPELIARTRPGYYSK
jgi:VWFA-related protein